MKTPRIIIVGAGGSGKDHLAALLVNIGYRRAVSLTTRPKRTGEEDGVTYWFVTAEEFNRRKAADEFREHCSFGDLNWQYGSLRSELQTSDLVILNPSGLAALTPEERAGFVVVFLDIPVGVRRQRLDSRSDADLTERRLSDDARFFSGFVDFDVRVTDSMFELGDVMAGIADYSKNAEVSHGDRERQPDTHSTHKQP